MTPIVKTDRSDLIYSSISGVGRGFCVRLLIHPLDVIKTSQQFDQKVTSWQAANRVWTEQGIFGFYRGVSPQLLRTCFKQAWVWPAITYVSYSVSDTYYLAKEVLAGLAIASLDAVISTPLERAKIGSIVLGKKISFQTLFKEGWKGCTTHWMKLAICWPVFLSTQKIFRDKYRGSGKPLTASQLLEIGVKTSVIVSITSAPFDMATTQKMAKNINLSAFFAKHGVRTLFRGSPINTFSLMIQNIASIALIDQLERR